MRSFGVVFVAVSLVSMAAAGSLKAEVLLEENFDELGSGTIAGQGGWSDNSKSGAAEIIGEDSFSAPHHLGVWEGGAVHRAIPAWTGSPTEIVMEFAFRRNASEAGKNLQISLRGKGGESVLFLNLRGSGLSLDAGRNAEGLTEYSFASEIPKDAWLRLRMSWSLLSNRLQLKVLSTEDATEYLDTSVELAPEPLSRIIVGSTSKTFTQDWALDDLLLQVKN